MKRFVYFIFLLSLFSSQGCIAMKIITLPQPQIIKSLYLDQAIQSRRSVRNFSDKELTLSQISQLLWAGDGITDPRRNYRSAPSAGALYPLDMYVIKKDGAWKYIVSGHELELVNKADVRNQLAHAALGQNYPAKAPVSIVIVAEYKRSTRKYGNMGIRYSHIEAGHIAQNLLLEAVALGLGSVPVGAFYGREIIKLLHLPNEQEPLYIISIGYKK